MPKTVRGADRLTRHGAAVPASAVNNSQFRHVVAAREYLADIGRGKTATVKGLCGEFVARGVLNAERAEYRLRTVLRQKQEFALIAGNGRSLKEVLPDIAVGHHAIAAGVVQDFVRDGRCHWVSRTGTPSEWTFGPGPGAGTKGGDDERTKVRESRPLSKIDLAGVPGAATWSGLATGLRGVTARHPLADGTGPWSAPNCPQLGLTSEWVYATPALACCWWLLNVENNRNLIFSRVEHYAADMLQDRWSATNMAIGMTFDGQLFDGQNRLVAVWLSRVPTLFLVAWGLPLSAMPAVDNNTPRHDADADRIAGGSLVSGELAVGRAMLSGPITASRTVSRSARIAATTQFLPAIRTAREYLNRVTCKKATDVAVAAVHAALARAILTNPKRRADLVRFMQLLAGGANALTGATPAADRTAVALRETLVTLSGPSNSGRNVQRYRITQTALRSFLDGERLTSPISPTNEDCFPLTRHVHNQLRLKPQEPPRKSAAEIWDVPL